MIRTSVQIVEKSELLDTIRKKDPELLVTFGAGDIDRFCTKIAALLSE